MIRSITVNYDARDFFGRQVMRSETCEGSEWCPIGAATVDKVFRAVRKGDFYAHFNYADGTCDTVYRDLGGDGLLTVIHRERANSPDEPQLMRPAAARRRIVGRVEE